MIPEWFTRKKRLFDESGFAIMPNFGGWGNGYVAIPPGYPGYGMLSHIFEIWMQRLPVHINFAENANDLNWEEVEKFKDHWIVGFDTLHWHMKEETWTKEKVEETCAEIAFKIFELWMLKEREKNHTNSSSMTTESQKTV